MSDLELYAELFAERARLDLNALGIGLWDTAYHMKYADRAERAAATDRLKELESAAREVLTDDALSAGFESLYRVPLERYVKELVTFAHEIAEQEEPSGLDAIIRRIKQFRGKLKKELLDALAKTEVHD